MEVRATIGLLALGLSVGFAGVPAHAGIVNDTSVPVTTATNTFISGTGIQIDHFHVDSEPATVGAQNLSVSLKARNRDVPGEPDNVSGNVYTVQKGPSANPARPQLAIDLQFDPGADNTTNYLLRLSVDFDPSLAGTAFSVTSLNIHGTGAWDDTDGYFLNGFRGNGLTPTAGAWNTATVPYVVSNTTNLGFLVAPPGFTYDQNAFADYTVRLEVLDPTGTTVLANSEIVAHVVPEPASMSLVGIGGVLSLFGRRRRVV